MLLLLIIYITSSFIHEATYFCNDQQISNNMKLSQRLYFLLLVKCVNLLVLKMLRKSK